MPIKYYSDTPAEELLGAFERARLGNCSGNPILFFQQSGAKTVMDMVLATPRERWAVWDLVVLGRETDTKVRKILIAKITEPMTAFKLYLDLDFWTDEEDVMLWTIFNGKLPTAEKELKDGTIQSKKLRV